MPMEDSKLIPYVRGVTMATPAVAVSPGAAPKMTPMTTPSRIQPSTVGVMAMPRPVMKSEKARNSMCRILEGYGRRTEKP